MSNPSSTKSTGTSNHRLCASKGCNKAGAFKAPLTHSTPPRYTWLCLEHVRKHNAEWNYMAGCSEEEAEKRIRQTTVWERPTWPFNRGPELYTTPRTAKTQHSYKNPHQTMPKNIQEAAHILKLTHPFTIHKAKERYRALAKKYHPDLNNGKRTDIEKFHKLQLAFKTMQAYLQKEDPTGK